MPLDYSKWKNIEISDDEDDTHPNIDTPSLFRWRHQARLERMQEFENRKQTHKKEHERITSKRKSLDAQLSDDPKNPDLLKEKKQLEEDFKKWETEEYEINKAERLAPWNVDTISHEKFSKTIINKDRPIPSTETMSDEELAKRYKEFIDKYEKDIKTYGMLRKYEDSQRFLIDHQVLVCEDAANYLVVWCIDLEMEEKHDLMEHVAHQTIVLQFILELSKSLKRDPRDCIRPFFSRMSCVKADYIDGFNEELDAFKQRIRNRAKEKLDQLIQDYEREERQKRLGPGGLDPVEVMESLPSELKKCFETQDVPMLKSVLLSMPKEDAHYHLDRCIKSGLWVPGKGGDDENEEESACETSQSNDQIATVVSEQKD